MQLDHCFARIILDAVIGRSEDYSSGTGPAAVKASPDPTPWTSKLKSPAIRHVESTDLAKCINLGEAIAAGKVDLVQLDEESLKHRGKLSKVNHSSLKRKMNAKDDQDGSALKNLKISSPKSDIRAAFGAIVPPPLAPARVDVELSNLIKGSSLTGFRKRVLLALCQVPRGSVSSYLAISDFLDSSPRAVGNALRNNPFAPRAPCHRVSNVSRQVGVSLQLTVCCRLLRLISQLEGESSQSWWIFLVFDMTHCG